MVERQDIETREMKTRSELQTTCELCVQRNTSDITEPMMFIETQACRDDLTEREHNVGMHLQLNYMHHKKKHRAMIHTKPRACADCSAHEATPSMSQGE